MQHSNNISPIERILSFLTYTTTGLVGFVWLIIAAILKKQVTPFLMYHILQSIFISIAYVLLCEILKYLYIILYRIPVIKTIPTYLNASIPIAYNLSVIQIITTAIILYLAITAFMGKYSYFPWISDIINENTGRRY